MTMYPQISEDVEMQDVKSNRRFSSDPNHWRVVFDKYDANGDGVISLSEMRRLLRSGLFSKDIPDDAVAKIIDLADHNQDGHLHFKEFLHLVHCEELPEGVWSHFISVYVHNLVAPRRGRVWHDVVDGQYEEEYTCFPPPIAMLLVALIIMGMYLFDTIATGNSFTTDGPIGLALIYNPYKRDEVWRFVTYMFVHVGAMHLLINMMVLLMLGIPLEMVHHWWRVLIVFIAGVFAGSLATSITDPTVFLAGASGGVYAIITAHLATIIMNWSEMSFAIWQLIVFLLLMAVDVGTAIYQRYWLQLDTKIGYMAHFAGAIAGLLVGIYVLRNLNKKSWEKYVWWASIFIFFILLIVCIVWNAGFPDHFLKKEDMPSKMMFGP